MKTILKKDLLLFFGDKKAVMLTFLMPIGLITLFALAFGGTGTDTDVNPLVICIADEDNSTESKKLIASIDSLDALIVKSGTWVEMSDNVKKGKYAVALRVKKKYNDSIDLGFAGFELIYDDAKNAEAGMIQGILTGQLFSQTGQGSIKKKVISKMEEQFGEADEETKNLIYENIDEMMNESSFTESSSDLIQVNKITSPVEINPALVHAVAGTSVMTLLFAVAAIGASLLDEKEKGTLKKLLLAPINPIHLLFGKMASAIVIGILQLLVMLVFAQLVFGLPILTNLPALLILVFFTAVTCAAFGIFLASVCTSRKQIEGLSTVTVLVMSALGGSMMPLFFMPSFMQNFAVFTVNYWSIQGFFDIFWREFEWSTFLMRMLVLLGMSTFMLLLAIPFFKKNILRLT